MPDLELHIPGDLPQKFGAYPKVSAEDLLEHFAIHKGTAGDRAQGTGDHRASSAN